jgi:hypothetical protein
MLAAGTNIVGGVKVGRTPRETARLMREALEGLLVHQLSGR